MLGFSDSFAYLPESLKYFGVKLLAVIDNLKFEKWFHQCSDTKYITRIFIVTIVIGARPLIFNSGSAILVQLNTVAKFPLTSVMQNFA